MPLRDQLLADHRLGIAAEQHAVRQDAGGLAGAFMLRMMCSR
jgi:hypothetical protein